MEAPVVNVGIMTEKAITFSFNGEYVHTATGEFLSGEQRALFINGKVVYNGKMYDELFFEPASPGNSFDLKAVTIGVDFHWQREQDQRFNGALNLVASKDGIIAINQVDVENYLTSVISSEMNAHASKQLLKTHAVISRSWLFAQIEKRHEAQEQPKQTNSCLRTDKELIKWYDREDHTLFDVCADDHCQRYQGITYASSPTVKEAVEETRGEILTYEEKICDTRFSKCCGGVTECFENCWEPVPHPYLRAVRDDDEPSIPDLSDEATAAEWITSVPDSYCHTTDEKILKQILNNYDQETKDFYRWKVVYSQKELSELIYKKTGINFGEITDLVPLERGKSGRIVRLKIIGTRYTYTIGKELEIRKVLSESHLYSSAFIVEKQNYESDIPQQFTIKGAGWGHGVGLCQIGAAMMSEKGFSYQEILEHYFPGTYLEKRY